MPVGDSINAGLINVDYSGVERAGQSQAAMYQSVGQSVSGAISGYGDYVKEQKQMEQEAGTAASIASLIAKKAPGLVPGAEEMAMTLQDKEIPLSERYSKGQQFMQSMGMGFKIEEQLREREMFELQKQRIQQSLSNSSGGGGGYSMFGGPAIMPEGLSQAAGSVPGVLPERTQGFSYPE